MTVNSKCPSCKRCIAIPEKLFDRSFLCPKCIAKLQSSSFDPEMIVPLTPIPSPNVPPPIQPVVAPIARILSRVSTSYRVLFPPVLFISITAVLSVGTILAIFSCLNITPGDTARKQKLPEENAIGVGKETNGEIHKADHHGIGVGFGLLHSPSTEISVFSYFQTIRLTRRLLVGFKIYLEIRNQKSEAIESMSFVFQDQSKGRRMPNSRIQIGGIVQGGIEPKSAEVLIFFVPNTNFGLAELETHVSSDSVFEIAINEVRYTNGDVLSL